MKKNIDPKNLRAMVQGFQLFKFMDEEGRERLLEKAERVSYQPGEVVVREGDPGDALYMVLAGEVRVYTTREGQEVDLANLGHGACFGEVALLSGRQRTATVMALTPCTVLRFPGEHIEALLESYPKVRRLLESVVRGRARDTIEKLTSSKGKP